MKLFSCSACRSLVFFESVRCTTCGNTLAYLPDLDRVGALQLIADNVYLAVGLDARYRLCANSIQHAVCNWAIPDASGDVFCRACSFNVVIPDLSDPTTLDKWRRLEIAKRRLFYSLAQLGLPLETKVTSPRGLAFAFKQDLPGGEKVVTGHEDGLVTINVAEADAPFREYVRQKMQETYRTLLGHFRHESGHYYWARLIDGTPELDAFRALFGDERAGYAEAGRHHYDHGPPEDWRANFVSGYASMHPWEDWAETWAHYLHMVDTLETARSYGLALRPAPQDGARVASVVVRRLAFDDFDDLVTAWIPLTLALNSLNRSMGLDDAYAFVISDAAIAKQRFVHETIERCTAR